jgi:hypothetical protein
MKALSLLQPWATLYAHGKKRFETRSWDTTFRGRFVIHASGRLTIAAAALCYREPFHSALLECGVKDLEVDLPFGAILGIADLKRTWKTSEIAPSLSEMELAFGNYEPRRYAFETDPVAVLEQPITCGGHLDFWDVPQDVLRLLPVEYRQAPPVELPLFAGVSAC